LDYLNKEIKTPYNTNNQKWVQRKGKCITRMTFRIGRQVRNFDFS
jgi:hypothetical protein